MANKAQGCSLAMSSLSPFFPRAAGPIAASPCLALPLARYWAHPACAVALLTLVAGALRLHRIAAEPFWKNELFSLAWIRQPYGFLLGQGLLTETNPPLHFVLLKLWTGLFGTGELAVRAPSALAAAACIPLIYLLARRLAGDRADQRPGSGHRVGLVAATLLTLAPAQIVYAQEGRAYALLPLFLLLAMLGLVRFLQPGARSSRAGLWLYAGAAVALLYSHGIALFMLAALVLAVALLLAGDPAPSRRLRQFAWATAAVGLLALPQAAAMLAQARSANIEWIEPFGLDTLLIANRTVLIGPMVRNDLGAYPSHILLLCEMALATLTTLLLIPAAFRCIAGGSGPDRPARALLIAFPLLFVALVSVVSLARPVLIPRVAIWLGVPVGLVGGFLFVRGHGWLCRATGLLLAACIAVGLVNNVILPAGHKPDWPALVRDNPAASDAPLLVAAPHAGPLGLAFYGARDGAPATVPRLWTVHPERPPTLAEALERRVTGAEPIDTESLGTLIRGGRHVRLFFDEDDLMLLSQSEALLAGFGPMTRRDYSGLVVLSW